MKNIFIVSILAISLLFACSGKTNEKKDVADVTKKEVSIPEKKAGDIRIMQYNIHYGVGMDGVYDIDRIVEVINKLNADVIILNEVDNNYSDRSGYMFMAREIAEKLNMNYVHASSIILPPNKNSEGRDREVGNSFLTGFKLDSLATHTFSKGDKYDRIITKVMVTLDDGRKLYVAGTHLGLIPENRVIEVNEALDFLSDVENEPLILAGDLNAEPGVEEINILLTKYKDAFADNPLLTFPADSTVKRIDYIFGSDKIVFRDNASVFPTLASDHLPIIVDITF